MEETVVTGSRIENPRQAAKQAAAADLGGRLRAAAAGGRMREVKALLARGAEVDAVDGAGETALMKAVQEGQIATAEALRRQGASLDLKNHDGRSVRDMAVTIADPELNKALGLDR